ncbi:helix-turn-helix domain-containing protein [Streptomyces griseofuscus]|uniref:Helix-turn-helix domain protein n=1 Tax=Streptomyces griseofuscus TaxID=146922 RepID=A0A7H1Q913_9ACTN|nr:helix-turn-helix domain-containing protein [Streptomyces griseofuscus]QNT96793.1 Helix-turn-helix domain protein [Streptomyces griseofuscus]
MKWTYRKLPRYGLHVGDSDPHFGEPVSRNHACAGQDEWLTPREVARITKLSVQTLANHRSQRAGIPYTKLGTGRAGRIRYRRSDVERYLTARAVA